VNATLISALAALGGAAMGGAMSSLGSWLVQRESLRAEWRVRQRERRQDLYKEFIEEASKGYLYALERNQPDIASLVTLYGKASRLRVLSSPKVIAGAETIVRRIIETYREPSITLTNDQMHEITKRGTFDILRKFSETCRDEFDSDA
jgi:hypothetical protein